MRPSGCTTRSPHVATAKLRPHVARTLWHWSDALESQLDAAEKVLLKASEAPRAQRVLRAYRLYLAGSAMCFEEGWISLHQILATRPAGDVGVGSMKGAQSVYPFNREYIYR